MRRNVKLLTFIIGAIVMFVVATLPLSAQPQLTAKSKLAINGIGSVQVGMTVAQAERSAKMKFQETGGRAGTGGCYYLRPQRGPQGLAFMVISPRQDERIDRNNDRIARVDVYKGSRITTLRGARIGDTSDRIKSLYPGQIRVTPHKYTSERGGRYLTFIPKDAADRNYRLIFETLNNRVTQFRSGRLPEVEFVEGCA